MLSDLPADVCKVLDLIRDCHSDSARRAAYNLLWSKCQRYGLRWEWFT